MKTFISTILFFLICNTLMAQTENVIRGYISFISSENVYVRFDNTLGIRVGDTLFAEKAGKLQPAVIVHSLSSLSCVGKAFSGFLPVLNLKLLAIKHIVVPLEVKIEKEVEPVSVIDLALQQSKKNENVTNHNKKINGRISLSSYTNLSNNKLNNKTPNTRLKYNFALNSDSISGSGFSFENYMSYSHQLFDKLENFRDVNINNLAIKYDFKNNSRLIFGRKININTANIGAIDGFQFDKKLKSFSVGALVGSRPNDSTYFVDPLLFQYGAYISHTFQKEHKSLQTSLAFFNQTNKFVTDRRYLYFQHSNNIFHNVDFFGSAEVDLFSLENNQPVTSLKFTSSYLSLSYRPVKNLSLSASFDARRNVYYFETYKNRIDSLLDMELRQGLRFRFNYHPFRYFTWGGSAGYRLNSPTSNPSSNAITYLTYSKLPFIDASITLTGTALNASSSSGFIYGISMSKVFFDGKISVDGEYRKAQIFNQDIAELDLFWYITDKFILSINTELTLDNDLTLGRFFVHLSRRF